jgi:cation diffusion facilitator CzcD-associated flavoprotein CzcO
MSSICDVAIVGAGPYGLSAAAHLRAAGVEARVFGRTMEFWERQMPAVAALLVERLSHLRSESSADTRRLPG